jgi:hypothetical protein
MDLRKKKTELIIALVVVAIAAVFAINKCTHKPAVLVTEIDSVQYWKNRAGDAVATVIKSKDDFAKASSKIDSLAKLLKVKPSSIQSHVEVITHGKDSLTSDHTPLVTYYNQDDYISHTESNLPEENCPPPMRMLSETFWNDYYTADARIDSEGDSSYLHIQSTDTVAITFRDVKTGSIFNRKTFLELDATNANRNNTIVGLSGYRKQVKRKNFSLSVQVGYGFSKGFQPQVYGGIGLGYHLINF